MKKKQKDIRSERGFTLIELLIGSSIMVVVILGALFLYAQSNKITVDQQQFTELQHNVRSGMFFATRDIRSAGVGLPTEFGGYFLEGMDNEAQGGAVAPDRLRMMGNIENPLSTTIQNYQGGEEGGAANATVNDFSFEQNPYPDEFYDDKYVLVLPRPDSGCRTGQVRQITHVTHSETGTNERFNFSPGLAPDVNPPGGLSGTCDSPDDYDGGLITFIEVKEYWLDVNGNFPGLTPGVHGYIGNGQGGVLYLTQNAEHYPLAHNIENLQFEYNGDFDDDGALDGFRAWNPTWTNDAAMVSRIGFVRVSILGCTENPFVSVSGTPPAGLSVYRRPPVANSPGEDTNDMRRRFLLQSTVSIRNLSFFLYNTGSR